MQPFLYKTSQTVEAYSKWGRTTVLYKFRNTVLSKLLNVLSLIIPMFFFCLGFARPLCASVYVCLVVTCLERADLLALVCGV